MVTNLALILDRRTDTRNMAAFAEWDAAVSSVFAWGRTHHADFEQVPTTGGEKWISTDGMVIAVLIPLEVIGS